MSRARKTPARAKRQNFYHSHLRSKKWQSIRYAALRRAGWRCERCSDTSRLEVHHKTYRNLGDEPPEDLEVLCRRCHQHHHRAEKIERAKARRRAARERGRAGN